MTCYKPVVLYLSNKGPDWVTGKWPLKGLSKGIPTQGQQVPCGRCTGCRLEYSRQWAIRCVCESKMHEDNVFLTLTYNDESLVYGKDRATLYPRDLQLFMKRLRKAKGEGIKYYACGEYGEANLRPHYHACIFGTDFKDKKLYSVRNQVKNYTSEEANALWQGGNVILGDVNFETAAYTARYVMNRDSSPAYMRNEIAAKNGIYPEFVRMSRRPGIGANWYEKYQGDVYPHDYLVIRNGIKCKPVKYYNQKYSLNNPEQMFNIKEARKEAMEKHYQDNLLDRLSVREQVKDAQLSQLKRII